jgi:hypothetical protein
VRHRPPPGGGVKDKGFFHKWGPLFSGAPSLEGKMTERRPPSPLRELHKRSHSRMVAAALQAGTTCLRMLLVRLLGDEVTS